MLTHRGTVDLHTERLLLRRYTLADAADMFKNYAADERVTQFLCWPPYQTVQDIETYLQSVLAEYAKSQSAYNWAIVYEGEMIGSISVTSLDERNQSCEIGYCIGHAFWGRGITSEALAAVLRFLFQQVNLRRIIAKHDDANPASGKVMEKCGMTYEGRLRAHYVRNDGTVGDALVYGILKEEFV